MKNNNCVIFKANKNGLIIFLDSKIDFGDIKKILLEKIKSSKKFFDNSKTTITFKGKKLNYEQEQELLNIISNTANIDIYFVNNNKNSDIPFINNNKKNIDENLDKNKDFIKNFISNISSIKNINSNNDTLFYKGSLRSGQIIQYNGSVVVIGSVNPGAKIIAYDNIIVLGSIKGIVHAGCNGNNNCFISSLNLICSQLRISKFIACINKNNSPLYPSLAYVNNNKIYIEPLI